MAYRLMRCMPCLPLAGVPPQQLAQVKVLLQSKAVLCCCTAYSCSCLHITAAAWARFVAYEPRTSAAFMLL